MVRKRAQVILVFKIIYLILLSILFYGGRSVYYQDQNYGFFYQLAVNFGRTGLVFYIITLIPGIARRFGIKHKLVSILHILRRYIGISMFLLVVIHFWFIRGIDIFFKGPFRFSFSNFELMGITAYFLTIPLFLTSNDFSTVKLGKLWFTIHKLTYIIMFFIFLHVALQRLSIWTILMGVTVLAQLTSHINGRISNNE